MTGYVYRGDDDLDVRTIASRDFQRMTPKQRRGLAAKRERQVGAAQRQHVRRGVLSESAMRDTLDTLDRLIGVVAGLMPIPVRDLCEVPDCGLFARTRGVCDKHYRWIRAHERSAA